MTHRSLIATLAVLAFATACGKKPPETTPSTATLPNTPRGVNQDSIDRARADSIRAQRALDEANRLNADRAREAARAALVNALAETIHFGYNIADISPEDQGKLTRKSAIMKANPALKIRITGHADERGSDEYNLALGMRRATAAKDFLVRLGIDASRIEVASLGREVPVDSGSNEEAWARNRRDEFEITAGGQTLVGPN